MIVFLSEVFDNQVIYLNKMHQQLSHRSQHQMKKKRQMTKSQLSGGSSSPVISLKMKKSHSNATILAGIIPYKTSSIASLPTKCQTSNRSPRTFSIKAGAQTQLAKHQRSGGLNFGFSSGSSAGLHLSMLSCPQQKARVPPDAASKITMIPKRQKFISRLMQPTVTFDSNSPDFGDSFGFSPILPKDTQMELSPSQMMKVQSEIFPSKKGKKPRTQKAIQAPCTTNKKSGIDGFADALEMFNQNVIQRSQNSSSLVFKRKGSSKPKFQLDQPLMPLDYAKKANRAKKKMPHKQDIEPFRISEAGATTLGMKRQNADLYEDYFSVGSMQDLLVQSPASNAAQSFQYTALKNSMSSLSFQHKQHVQSKVTKSLKYSPPVKQSALASMNKSRNKFINVYSKNTHKTSMSKQPNLKSRTQRRTGMHSLTSNFSIVQPDLNLSVSPRRPPQPQVKVKKERIFSAEQQKCNLMPGLILQSSMDIRINSDQDTSLVLSSDNASLLAEIPKGNSSGFAMKQNTSQQHVQEFSTAAKFATPRLSNYTDMNDGLAQLQSTVIQRQPQTAFDMAKENYQLLQSKKNNQQDNQILAQQQPMTILMKRKIVSKDQPYKLEEKRIRRTTSMQLPKQNMQTLVSPRSKPSQPEPCVCGNNNNNMKAERKDEASFSLKDKVLSHFKDAHCPPQTKEEVEDNEQMRGLLSRSVESKEERAALLITPYRKLGIEKQCTDPAVKGLYTATTATGIPYMFNMQNQILAATEPSNSKSVYNQSVGRNDDSISQISSCRQRRAQYHRMLSAGQVDEVQRQISIEIQSSNNQDAISLYTRAKVEEKQKNYEKAIETFGKVLDLDPNFFNAAYAKASCENIIGQYDNAIQTYNIALAKDNDAPMVVSQTSQYHSRITSRRNSPANDRLRSQARSYLANSQSPLKLLHQIEPLSAQKKVTDFCDGNHDEHLRNSHQQLSPYYSRHRGGSNFAAQPFNTKIVELDQEQSGEVSSASVIKISPFNMVAAKANETLTTRLPQDHRSLAFTNNGDGTFYADEVTPSFQHLATLQHTGRVSARQLFTEQTEQLTLGNIDRPSNQNIPSQQSKIQLQQRDQESSSNQQPHNISNAFGAARSQQLSQGFSKPAFEGDPKASQSKQKSPQPWPQSDQSFIKNNQATNVLSPMLNQNGNVTIIGSVNIQLQQQDFPSILSGNASSQQLYSSQNQSPLKPVIQKTFSEYHIDTKLSIYQSLKSSLVELDKSASITITDKKDQKEQLPYGTPEYTSMHKDSHNVTRESHQQSDNKGQMLQEEKIAFCQSLQASVKDQSKLQSPITRQQDVHDFSQTYKHLSSHLLRRDCQQSMQEQPELFMLALTSYKQKKYGECLFAVSQIASAVKKTESQCEVISPFPKAQIMIVEQTLQELPCTENLNTSMSTFDGQGNLTRFGQVQLGYLKAKCLCKLQRYSECLFQLAKIKQMSQTSVTLLPERQQNKMELYKAQCLMHTKQFKAAVQILNQMLSKVAPQQDDLLKTMRESHQARRKPLATLLICAYSCRGQANEELQDYQQAMDDYKFLIQLSQFQDLPSEKIFEYMNARSIVSAKLDQVRISC